MKQTINFSQFVDNWPKSREDQFSYKALKAIFDHLEQYEKENGTELEYDPIAICCEFTEYKSLKELQEDYIDIETLEDLEKNTIVLPLEGGGLVIRDF